MKYIQKIVYIVVDIESGIIHRVFGIEEEAKRFVFGIDNVVIQEWPTEFVEE